MHIVITGTSRGIGLELTKQALAKQHHVLAVARAPEKSQELMTLRSKAGDRLQTLAVELTDPEAAAKVANAVKSWPAVDVLINNAGIFRDSINIKDFLESFQVNSIVPFQITSALLPMLRKSRSPKA